MDHLQSLDDSREELVKRHGRKVHVLHKHEQPDFVVFQGAHKPLNRSFVLQFVHIVLFQPDDAAGVLFSIQPSGLARCVWEQENAPDGGGEGC